MFLILYITCSCIFMHTYLTFSISLYIDCVWCFSMCFSLPLSLLFTLVESWHLNVGLLRPRTIFVLGHPLLLILLPHMFSSMIIKPDRTFWRIFLDKAFIRNVKSFFWTSLTLTYPLLFTIGVGSHCVTSWSLIHPCLSRSSTPTCMYLIIQYLSLLLTFEVRASLSLQLLYPRCSISRG